MHFISWLHLRLILSSTRLSSPAATPRPNGGYARLYNLNLPTPFPFCGSLRRQTNLKPQNIYLKSSPHPPRHFWHKCRNPTPLKKAMKYDAKNQTWFVKPKRRYAESFFSFDGGDVVDTLEESTDWIKVLSCAVIYSIVRQMFTKIGRVCLRWRKLRTGGRVGRRSWRVLGRRNAISLVLRTRRAEIRAARAVNRTSWR